MQYNIANFIIKCTRDKLPTIIARDIEMNLYHNERYINPKLQDLSKKKIGKQCVQNWAGSTMEQITCKWCAMTPLEKD